MVRLVWRAEDENGTRSEDENLVRRYAQLNQRTAAESIRERTRIPGVLRNRTTLKAADGPPFVLPERSADRRIEGRPDERPVWDER